MKFGELPTDPRERIVFCDAYGIKFDGDNHEDALAYARFAVFYQQGMKLGPWSPEAEAEYRAMGLLP